MRIRRIPVSQINVAAYHPRAELQPDDPQYQALQKSLDTFGLVEPLVWNQRSGNLVGGWQRLKLLQARGDRRVEVSVVNLDPKREQLLTLALKRIRGEWDEEKLAALLADLQKQHADITLTGFTDEEIDDLMAAVLAEEKNDTGPEPKIDQAAKLQRNWRTKVGQLWQIGDHRLLCGDCTNEKLIKTLMGSVKADLVFTDPPYGVNYVGSAEHLRIQNDNLGDE